VANLALFDFDGTITTEDTFTAFLFYASSKSRIVIGLSIVWPVIALYKIGWLPASKTRPILSKVAYWHRKESDVIACARHFNHEYLNKVVRPEMVEKIRWHQQQGDEVIVVSASLDPYLRIWCEQQGVKFICSQLEVRGARYTGRYVQGDCSEERKVTFLKSSLNISQFGKIYAYGDTPEDLPMLELADVKYYQGQELTQQ
jgi:HAD superfamily hydrolase (TIGR01490 family)